MAIHQNGEHLQQHQTKSFFLDALYCEEVEEQWEEEEEEEERDDENKKKKSNLPHSSLSEHDLYWEDEELVSLLAKEKQTQAIRFENLESDPCLVAARKKAVEWMLKVRTHYSFSSLTAILAINYLDRFLSGLHFQKNKPWMIQIAAVSCLSLAAKVEETHVPLLLDFQVVVEEEGTDEYVFEAKTIQKMELMVLSSLEWRMNPVSPISFLDHAMRRLGSKNHHHHHLLWEFLRRCENLLVSVVADWRFVRYEASVMATATMLHVIHHHHQIVEASSAAAAAVDEYQSQLLGLLKISEEKVNDCYQLIEEHLSSTWLRQNVNGGLESNSRKRRYDDQETNPSCTSVLFDDDDASSTFASDSDGSSSSSSSSSSSDSASDSSSTSPALRFFKKVRFGEDQLRIPTYLAAAATTPNSQVFLVDAVGSPC